MTLPHFVIDRILPLTIFTHLEQLLLGRSHSWKSRALMKLQMLRISSQTFLLSVMNHWEITNSTHSRISSTFKITICVYVKHSARWLINVKILGTRDWIALLKINIAIELYKTLKARWVKPCKKRSQRLSDWKLSSKVIEIQLLKHTMRFWADGIRVTPKFSTLVDTAEPADTEC